MNVAQKKLSLLSTTVIAGAALGVGIAVQAPPARAQTTTLTILHNNDGESKLTRAPSSADFGGIDRFVTRIDQLRSAATSLGNAVLTLSSGDNFLAGAEFNASLETLAGANPTFFDAIGLARIQYDALSLGNHEFDFGPQLLADFITYYQTTAQGTGTTKAPFLAANLDFSGEASLNALVGSGAIAKSTVVEKNGQKFGIIGAVTEFLPNISSPGNVTVSDVKTAVQAEIDALGAAGINKIVLVSQLQSITDDLALIPQLRGLDIAIAGGGNELLANSSSDLLVPGDSFSRRFGPYPVLAQNADGDVVPVITTPGDYKYVGQLSVTFDDATGKLVTDGSGNPIIGADIGLKRVSGVAPDAVVADPTTKAAVVDPVNASISALKANVIAQSEVALEGRRSPGIRTDETNLGNLFADAILWQGKKLADANGLAAPIIALQNGGGIRNNSLIPVGNFTEFDTFSIAAFANFISLFEEVPLGELKDVLENAYSRLPVADGRFAQIAGLRIIVNPLRKAREDDTPGSGDRVISIALDNGTDEVDDDTLLYLASSGFLFDPDTYTLPVATINFLATGGDFYPFRSAFTNFTTTYQEALFNYVSAADGLNGIIPASLYPEGGVGRISIVPEPASFAVFGFGLAGLLAFIGRRRLA